MSKKNWILISTLFILMILSAGFYFWRQERRERSGESPPSEVVISSAEDLYRVDPSLKEEKSPLSLSGIVEKVEGEALVIKKDGKKVVFEVSPRVKVFEIQLSREAKRVGRGFLLEEGSYPTREKAELEDLKRGDEVTADLTLGPNDKLSLVSLSVLKRE